MTLERPSVAPEAPLRVHIADDDPLVRRGLRRLLEGRSDVTIVGTSGDGDETIDAVQRLRPDVLLLDVQMPGRDGFSVVAALPPEHQPYVVFVTAYDGYAIDAFRVRALDFVLKPLDPVRLDGALFRARERLRERRLVAWADRLRAVAHQGDASGDAADAPLPFVRELLVRVGRREVVLSVDEIDWIEADSYYARLHAGQRSYLLRQPLQLLEQRLDPRHFSRVHRSAIVRLDRVREVRHDRGGERVVVLSTGAHVRASRNRWPWFATLLRQRSRLMRSAP